MSKTKTFTTEAERAGHSWTINLWEGEYPFRVQVVASDNAFGELDIDNRYRDFNTMQEAQRFIVKCKRMIDELKKDAFDWSGSNNHQQAPSYKKNLFLTQLMEAQ